MKEDRIYLQHISEAIDDIERYTADGMEVFFNNRMRQDAVIRKLEITGEASRQLSTRTKDIQPGIP